jgi:hypothetical protein
MKIPKFAERLVVKLLLSKAGPFVQKGVTAAAAAAISYIAAQIPGAESLVTPEVLAGLLWLVLDATVTKLAAGPLKEYARELQEFYNATRPADKPALKVDSWLGPVATEAITEKMVK